MSQKTEDLTNTGLCAVVVGLGEAEVAACTRALRPLEIIHTGSVAEACTSVARRRPLLVVIGAGMDPADEAALRESSLACGAEAVVPTKFDDVRALSAVLLEAIRVADKRRMTR